MTSLNVVPIKDMRPQMRGFTCEFIVLHKDPPNHLRNGDTIWMFTIADITGSVRMLLWNNDGVLLRPGDICRIYNAEAKLFQLEMQISPTRYGKIKRIGEDMMQFSESPNLSEWRWRPGPKSAPMVRDEATENPQLQPPGAVQPGTQPAPHQQSPTDPNPRDHRLRATLPQTGSQNPNSSRGGGRGRGRGGSFSGSRRGGGPYFHHHDFDRPGDPSLVSSSSSSSSSSRAAQPPADEFEATLGGKTRDPRLKRQQGSTEQDAGAQKRQRVDYDSLAE